MITEKLNELKNALGEAIDLHEKMRNSYFWNPPTHASSRRSYEKQNSFYYAMYPGLVLNCDTTCSCKNIYYKGYFELEGRKTTLTKIKNLYDAVCDLV